MADEERGLSEVQNYGTGRRKAAVARVFMRPGSGEITVNGRTLKDYMAWSRKELRPVL